MKSFEFISGNRIYGEQFNTIQNDILSAINPNKIPIPQWFVQLKSQTKQEIIYLISKNPQDDYYILYTHPVNKKMNKLFVAKKDKLLEFVENCFNEERGNGVDVVISDKSYDNLIVGNHDGLLFLQT